MVPIGEGAYMVAKTSAGGMFSSADAMKAELFREANAFCAGRQKQLVTVKVITLNAIPIVRSFPHAEVQFRCEAESARIRNTEERRG